MSMPQSEKMNPIVFTGGYRSSGITGTSGGQTGKNIVDTLSQVMKPG